MSELGKLRWHCRRGMKELDELLLGYLQQHYPSSSAQEKATFSQLLELQDPQLFAYLVGREIPSDPPMAAIIQKIAATQS